MLRFTIIFLACCCIAIAGSALADDVENRDELVKALRAEFYAFQARYDLRGWELQSLLGEMALSEKAIDKGGVGPIRDDIYIFVDGDSNGLSLRGERWMGKKSSEKEIVYLTSEGQMTTEKEFDANSGIIIFFSPDEVRYVDFSANIGHRYVRR